MPYHVPETVRPRTKYMHVHHAHDCHRLHYCTQRTEACISGAPREITETPLHRKEFIIKSSLGPPPRARARVTHIHDAPNNFLGKAAAHHRRP